VTFRFTAILIALVLTGCVDYLSSPTPASTPDPTQVSVAIKADEGGVVKVPGGTLTIPPGALDADTVITVSVRKPEDTAANAVVKGNIFDFGPQGLKFSKTATLELDVVPGVFTSAGSISKFAPNLGLWDEFGPTGSEFAPNLGLWDQTGDSASPDYAPNLGLWDAGDPNKMATGVTGFSSFATTRPGRGVYSCGVDSIGSPCCWGLRETAATTVPMPTTSDFVDVAPGAWSTCGLKFDGTIQCWGENPPIPPAESGFIQVTTGRNHACALKEDGTVECFMAEGTAYTVTSPTETDIVAVTAGDIHTCALQATGQIFCWGPARDGEGFAPAASGFVDVSAGSRHTCAVSADGRLTCWGSEISGIKRVPNAADRRFVQVSVGAFAACALTDVGAVICWGADNDVVTKTPSGTGYLRVIARHRHACAVAQNGAIECWGQDVEGSLAPPEGCFLPIPAPPECEIGYFPGETGCVDFDECLDTVCDINATCTNTPGDFTCACDSGFMGDGFTCSPMTLNVGQALSAGAQHNCAIRSGAIWCWGENLYGQLGDGTINSSPAAVQVGTANDWVDIASGADHTCAINSGGQLWCWGAGFSGELGDGTMSEGSSVPVRESTGANDWAQVTAGVAHTCALNTGGEIYCWGAGFAGQLGDGSTQSQTAVPVRESTNATNWAAVKAGAIHTCALDTVGNLSCWGANDAGQLGDGMVGVDSPVPVPITGGPWDKLALGGAHTCATSAGELYCWGSDVSGQIGLGLATGMMEVPVPTRVGTDTDWSIPVAGADTSCAVKASGSFWCWGANFEGQLGLGDTSVRNSPTQVGIDGDWITAELSAIGAHGCGVKGADVVVCWGANYAGQLGVASSRLAPAGEVDPGDNWSSVSAYGGEDVPFNLGVSSYGCGIKNGSPWCWGTAAYNFSLTDSTSAVPDPLGNTDWTQVSSSSTHSCGLQNGAPRCWGDNADGGLGDGSTTPSSSPVIPLGTDTDTDWSTVSSGSGFSCGIKSGALWCWGRGDEGQLGLGEPISYGTPQEAGAFTGTMWSTVSAAHTHACGIQAGDLYCWGDNAFGQLGDGSTFPSISIPAMPTIMGTIFTSVAAGREHTCAIDTFGNLLCTGDNTYGELGDGTSNPSTSFITVGAGQAPWSQVAVGRDTTCGIASGIPYCWGANPFGGLGNGTINDSPTPVAVSTTFTDWVEVSVGDVFTCGLRSGGQVLCWGDNGQGQMGDGSMRFLTPRSIALP
jgi:alpha-tubulin suppressor-like RCC1 family protein